MPVFLYLTRSVLEFRKARDSAEIIQPVYNIASANLFQINPTLGSVGLHKGHYFRHTSQSQHLGLSGHITIVGSPDSAGIQIINPTVHKGLLSVDKCMGLKDDKYINVYAK